MRAAAPLTPTTAARFAVRRFEACYRGGVATSWHGMIFPLAIPMLAGPGAIATVMVLMSRAEWKVVPTMSVFVAVTVTCCVCYLMMRSAARAERMIPKTLLRAFERVMGLLLAAVAVEFIAGGIRDIIRLK